MLEFLLKALPIFLTITITSIIFGWISRGSGNRRLYILGGIPILIALAIVGFDLTRKRYSVTDYSLRQIAVKQCFLDKISNGIIVANDDSKYPFDRSLLWKVGSAPELANLLCHQKNLKLWLNPENEISAFEGEDFTIPLEVGIARDDSNHSFLTIALITGVAGLAIIISAFRYDQKGKKITL
jgi:hypothetical protein